MRHPHSHRRSPRRRDRGAIIPLAALLLVTIFTSVAFAVDLGRLTSERRSMQADADMIALDLVRLANGRTEEQILGSVDYANVRARSAAANDIDPNDLLVEYGTYELASDTFTPTAATEVPDAVEVRASAEIDYFFARVFTSDNGRTNRTAMAALDSLTSMTLGSKTASVKNSQSVPLNFLLSTFLGEDVDLETDDVDADGNADLAGYEGLWNADVTLNDLAAASTGASPTEILSADITAQQYGLLMADALRNNGMLVEADVLEALALRANGTVAIKVGKIVDADIGGPPAVADTQLNTFDQFIAALQLVNETNAVDACAIVPNYSIAGLTNAGLEICTLVIDAGVTVIGRVGDAAMKPPRFRTAQVKATTISTADVDLDILGLARGQGHVVLPAEFQGGGAQGELLRTLCNPDATERSTDTHVTPRPIAATFDKTTPITTLDIVSAGVKVATVDVFIIKDLDPANGGAATIDDQRIDQTRQGPTSSPDLELTTVESLHLSADLTSGALPVGVSLTDITEALRPDVNALLANVEGPDVGALLKDLGLGVSGSDLRLNDIDCESPLLRG